MKRPHEANLNWGVQILFIEHIETEEFHFKIIILTWYVIFNNYISIRNNKNIIVLKVH